MSVTISYPSTQFEEFYGSFVNLGAHLPPKDNSLKIIFKNYFLADDLFNFLIIIVVECYDYRPNK